ncbi:MAG: hypothetical protein ACRC47_12310 [Shewanella sp.]
MTAPKPSAFMSMALTLSAHTLSLVGLAVSSLALPSLAAQNLADQNLAAQNITAQHVVSLNAESPRLSWVPVGTKQALICPLAQLSECLLALPSAARAQLPASPQQLSETLGQRVAMVMPLMDARSSGIVITNVNAPSERPSVNIDAVTYELKLIDQPTLTLWHELGHLENIALQGEVLPSQLTPYQHEWLADIYLIWQIAKVHGDFRLAWQQYHRRNLGAFTYPQQLSHWSVPMMLQVLTHYEVATVAGFSRYRDFVADFYPSAVQLPPPLLAEYASLMQRTFAGGAQQALPQYLYWRKAELGGYLQPTLIELMGAAKANEWLAQHSML